METTNEIIHRLPLTKNFHLLRQLAVNLGGECLENKIIDGTSKFKFRCKENHLWWAESHNIKKGTWCKICSLKSAGLKRRIPHEFILQIIKRNGGQILAKENSNGKIKLSCKENHHWLSTRQSLKNGNWCIICRQKENGIKRRTPFAIIKNIALEKGGECLSEKYETLKTKLKFKCSAGHVWLTNGQGIKNGSWCKICSSIKGQQYKRDNIDVFKKIIESRGGKLHTFEYKNSTETKLLVECEKGHQWIAFPGHIKKGLWCRKCNGSFKHELADVIKLAESRGGKCLSTVYKNDMTNITWQCSENHIWDATPNNIKRGKWCPTCVSGIGERVCRLTFEKIFNVHFNKARPKWLKNKNGFPLELDGYNDALKLAFEHQGMQHYGAKTKSKYLHPNLISNDKEKKEICKLNGVTVVYIPELFKYTKLYHLVKFILNELDKQNYNYPIDAREIILDPKEVYTFTKTMEVELREKRAIEILKLNKASLINIRRLNSGVYLTINCVNKHTLTTSFSSIISGQICKTCDALV